jgi:hypothetical protein
MLKTIRLGLAIAVTSMLASTGLNAVASEPDYPCYTRDSSGRIINLGGLCGDAQSGQQSTKPGLPAKPANPKNPSAKTAECNQFRQILSGVVPDMIAILRQLKPQNAFEQMDKMVTLYDRLLPQIERLSITDQKLGDLRSRYVQNLKTANNLMRKTSAAAKGGDLQTAQQLAQSSQNSSSKAMQIGREIDQYCGFMRSPQ